jgi:hypothetical protein
MGRRQVLPQPSRERNRKECEGDELVATFKKKVDEVWARGCDFCLIAAACFAVFTYIHINRMLKKLEAPENQGVMFSRTGRREGGSHRLISWCGSEFVGGGTNPSLAAHSP